MPLGVVGIIYEGRPNVTVDAAALCLKSGNAVAAARLVQRVRVEHRAGAGHAGRRWPAPGCPRTPCSWCPAPSRESVKQLMRARGLVDVLIPRGGASLINSVVEESTVPVIETGVGNCHVYVDAEADLDMADRRSWSTPRRSGRRCATPPRRSWCTQAVADEFLPRALRRARRRPG